MNYTRDYLSFGVGIGLSFVSEWFADLQIAALQKVFYLLSIAVLFVGFVRLLCKKKKTAETKEQALIEGLLGTQKATQVLDLASDPETKGEKVLSIIQLIKQGGIKMKAKLYGLGKLQWVSLVLTILLLALGIASTTFNIPELSFFADKLEVIFGLAGITAIPGIFSKGKQIGDVVGQVIPTKVKKEVQTRVRELAKKKEALAIKYAPFIEAFNDFKELGGKLTADEQLKYDTYSTQVDAIDKLIASEEAKLGVNGNAEII